MTNDLIERYIYAVTKRLPAKSRKDVSDELRTLIEDMLEERCQGMTPEEKDVKVVLTELGTPDELAEKYDTSTYKALIGPPYFQTYKFVLRIVVICTALGLAVAGVISELTTPSASIFEACFGWIGTIISGLMSGFAIVTLLFAFFSYKGIKLKNDSLDELPPVPKKKQEVSKADSIFGICICVIFLILFLAAPQIFGAYLTETHEFVPIFNIDIIRSVWYIPVIFSVAGIVREIIKLIEGRYNTRVMITIIITNVISAIAAIWWLMRDNIINLKFLTVMSSEDIVVQNVLTNFQFIFLGAILLALVMDTIVAITKTLSK